MNNRPSPQRELSPSTPSAHRYEQHDPRAFFVSGRWLLPDRLTPNGPKPPASRARVASFRLSNHAQSRMSQRSVRQSGIEAAIAFGRKVYTRGAVYWVIGRKEVENCSICDLRAFEGIHVVCTHNQVIKTVYRQRDLSKLRPKRRKRRSRRHRQRSY